VPAADPGSDRTADGPVAGDAVAGDGDDAVTFRVTRRRMFEAMAVAAVASWLVINAISGVLEVLVGRTPAMPEPVSLLVSAIVYALIFAGIFVVAVRRHPAWVTVSDHGVELAATGRDPVFLAWSSIETVDRRFWGPFADLVVTPTRDDAAQIARRGWSRPRTIVRAGHTSYVVDAGLMQPGPDVLLAEIQRRLAIGR
jgi:hypothetical protein